MVESHVLDLEQVLELGGSGVVRGGNTDDVWGADVVVFTAAAPLTVNTSRLDYLAANAAIARDLVEILGSDGSWPGALVVVTNPVDPICTWIQRSTGIDRTRVLGYTLNDSLRLRTGVAKALRIAPGTVDAWVLGEHGDACVPLFDRILVAGEPVALTDEQRAQAEEFFRTWYVRHVALDSGRSSTWTSGSGIARMVSRSHRGVGRNLAGVGRPRRRVRRDRSRPDRAGRARTARSAHSRMAAHRRAAAGGPAERRGRAERDRADRLGRCPSDALEADVVLGERRRGRVRRSHVAELGLL